jgi:ATP-binding cassette, subfamily B, bacterial
MLTKLRYALSQLHYIGPTLKLVWSAAPRCTTGWAILLFLQGFLPGATVYLTKWLVDSLVLAMKVGLNPEGIQLLMTPAVLMGLVLLSGQLAQSGLSILRTIQAEYVQDHIRRLVHHKSLTLDLAFHEQPEFHDRLHQARDNASTRPLSLLESTGSLIQDSITLVTIAAVLIPYGAWLPIALVVSSLPAFAFVVKFNRQYHRWWERTTPLRRQAEYHDFLISQSYTAAEVRLFDLGNYLTGIYYGLRQQLRSENIRMVQKQSLAQLGGSLISLVFIAVVLLWMLSQALRGIFTLGDIALFYQAFNRGQSLARSVLGQVNQIYSNTLFLSNLFEFLNLQPKILAPAQPEIPRAPRSEIRFRNVSFRYPGSDRWIFQDFNLTIPAGKVIAIVGENGAGKSTLIKLICRFYDPESGTIELDGIDIRNFDPTDWRKMLTVMFQFPVTYQKTVAENIAIGDVYSNPSNVAVRAALADAGATEIIDRLPKKEQTQLGKWFAEGTDLSGGEWQRIALARAFLREAPVLVLDEPTSFMDSWAEHDWLERFRQMANGRTAIVITHRFTLAMRADIIYVMQEGKMIESGDHNGLLAQNALYAQSWRSQTQATQLPVPDLVSS